MQKPPNTMYAVANNHTETIDDHTEKRDNRIEMINDHTEITQHHVLWGKHPCRNDRNQVFKVSVLDFRVSLRQTQKKETAFAISF